MRSFIERAFGATLRQILTLLSGWLVARAWLTEQEAASLVALLFTLLLNALPALLSLVWSFIEKARAVTETQAALLLPAGSAPLELEQAVEDLRERERQQARAFWGGRPSGR